MAQITSLNVTPQDTPSPGVFQDRIDMSTLGSNQHEPQVVYFYMRTVDEESVAQRVAKLALYSVLTAINAVPDEHKKRTYVVIDEFQVVALDILAKLFEQAAGLKVSYILSNQSLHTLPAMLQEVLAENTAFRQVFRAGGNTSRKFLRERSGETIYDLFNMFEGTSEGTVPGIAPVSSAHEVILPYYTAADIVATSYDPFTSWVEMGHGKGYSRYGGNLFEMRGDYHITYEEHQRRERLPWPDKTPSTLIAAEETRLLDEYATGPAAQVDARADAIRAIVPSKDEPEATAGSLFEPVEGKPTLRPIRPLPPFDQAVETFEKDQRALYDAIERGEPFDWTPPRVQGTPDERAES